MCEGGSRNSLGPTVATGSNTVATTFGHQGYNLSCRGRDLGPLGYNLPAVIRALAALFSEARVTTKTAAPTPTLATVSRTSGATTHCTLAIRHRKRSVDSAAAPEN